MTIYEELKKDHREVLDLMDRLIQSADATADQRNSLIEQVRDALIPHSRAEEAVFYNSIRQAGDAKANVMHAYGEHMMAEGLLRTLQVTGLVDAGWRQTAEKLRDALTHHIAEEEGEMFTQARRVLSMDEAEKIGDAFVAMKPEIQQQTIVGTTFDMIANMMPVRFTKSFREFGTSKKD